MSGQRSVNIPLVILLSLGAPGIALARDVTGGSIIADATPFIQLVMLLLAAAIVAALVMTARKIAAGRLAGRSPFVSALRSGGPLLGLFGGVVVVMFGMMGLSRGPQPFDVVAPGLAEAAFVVALGLLSGVVAVICHWALDARTDRTAPGA